MPKSNLPKQKVTASVTSGFRIHPSIPFVAVILILMYLGLNVWIYFYGTQIFSFNPFLKKSIETASVVKEQGFGVLTGPKPAAGKNPVYPLPAGKQEWAFTLAPGVTGPKIQTATVDPLPPKKGETQSITITVKHGSPVTATATIFTDTKTRIVTMSRTTGSDTDGTWSANWKMDDTYDRIYHIDFLLKSTTGDWSGGLTFR